MLYSSEIQLLSVQPRWHVVSHPVLAANAVQLWLCELQSTITGVSGNKILKLHYPLQSALQHGYTGIVTFGGAFSNHLCAVAASCQQLGLRSVAYVRTEQLDAENPTLAFCQARGMQLIAIDRQHYRLRHQPDYLAQLQQHHPDFLLVPEGGSSTNGARGVSQLALEQTPAGRADLVVTATASGGTLAGLINRRQSAALGIAVVKDASLFNKVQQLLVAPETLPWQLNSDFCGAGYARFSLALLQFCRELASQGIYTEPVYSGKALAGVIELVRQGRITTGSRLSFFHTGGLQGLDGLLYRGLITAADHALLSGSVAG
jgi:1-aminocyclopropane-1-carboxylate deaminase